MDNDPLREAAKKFHFLVVRPLRPLTPSNLVFIFFSEFFSNQKIKKFIFNPAQSTSWTPSTEIFKFFLL